jgi:hypothetical protein
MATVTVEAIDKTFILDLTDMQQAAKLTTDKDCLLQNDVTKQTGCARCGGFRGYVRISGFWV